MKFDLNFIEGKSGVQFVHRTLAYVVVAFIIAIWVRMRKLIVTRYQLIGMNTLLVGVGIQFLLGVLTIILLLAGW